MGNNLKSACDAILQKVATGKDRVPGVVAMITDRSANIYEGAAGERILGASQAMTTDTVFAIFSTTKAITGTAVLQCVEEGKLDLDAPAKTYVPDIGKLEVLDGFDAAGKPRLRAPKRDITTRMLMLHTAGLGYDFFNTNYLRLAQEHGQPSVITCSKASLMTPLLFDPGDKWEYGSNIDWCGQVVESIRGKRLGEVMTERIFAPLGMEDIAFSLTPSMRARLAAIHQREADGSLTPLPDLQLPPDPEVHMGGHGLYALDRRVHEVHPHVAERRGGAARPRAQERDGRGRCPQRPASAPARHDAARRHSDAVERCRVLPRPEEILVLHLHGERRGRADRPAGRGARLGRARQHCSSGSIARTGSADIGRRRSCRSATRLRSAATWISRRPPMRPVRRARRRNAGERVCATAPPGFRMTDRGRRERVLCDIAGSMAAAIRAG